METQPTLCVSLKIITDHNSYIWEIYENQEKPALYFVSINKDKWNKTLKLQEDEDAEEISQSLTLMDKILAPHKCPHLHSWTLLHKGTFRNGIEVIDLKKEELS